MKQFFKRALLTVAALALVLGTAALVLFVTACVDPMAQKERDKLALFAGLAADGTGTTTRLILIFSREIKGLSAEDITIEANGTGAVKGALSSQGSGAYYLELSGVKRDGEVEVSVEKKAGYSIANPQRSVTVRYYADTAAPEEAEFLGVTANGSSAETTTALTLVFDREIEGLSINDITLSGDTQGVAQAVSLTANGGGEYELSISGITANGGLTVTVRKEGFSFTPASRPVTVRLVEHVPVTLTSVTADPSQTGTTQSITLVFDKEISGLKESDITLSGDTGAWPWILTFKEGGAGYKYELALVGLESGGALTVSVAKTGYAITGAPATVTVYISYLFNDLTAEDGSETTTTTTLNLSFDKDIKGLEAKDIAFSDATGAKPGTLEARGDGNYRLSITGVAFSGTLTVSVNKAGCIVQPNSRQAQIFAAPPVPITIELAFQGPVEKTVTITRTVYNDFSKSRAGFVLLSVNNPDNFDRFEWLLDQTKIAEGNSVILEALQKDEEGGDLFKPGLNSITVLVHTGTVPWSGEVWVWLSD